MSPRHKNKNIIVFVYAAPKAATDFINRFRRQNGHLYRFAFLTEKKKADALSKEKRGIFDFVITCDFFSQKSMTQALLPFEDQILAITARGDNSVPYLEKIIPFVPYLKTPTVASLEWATHKLQMRRRFAAYDKSITPNYMVVKSPSHENLREIEKKIGFPLVVKPTGLAASVLVNICFHKEELEASLKKVFLRLNKLYKEKEGRGEPQVLVEQWMEGDMYSIDCYVNSLGKIYYCPMVSVKTGKQIGFDDFFGYQQMTPTILNKESIEAAQGVAAKSIKALCLRSTSVHIELMKTEDGWKIIEVGPRLGGFRDELYRLSYGIDHSANDVFIRIPRLPVIPRRRLGFAVAMKFFAKKEGRITKIAGVKKAQELKSFYSISVNKQVGDRATFAKHGGGSVFNIIMFNETRSRLLADIRRLEQAVEIVVE